MAIDALHKASAEYCLQIETKLMAREAATDSDSPRPAEIISQAETVTAIPPGKEPDPAAADDHSSAAKPDRRNLEILQATDGKRKTAVTLDVARRFGGVSRRAIQAAIRNDSLKASGKRLQRRVLVESLLEYFPPEN
jgi:hypothetical protein